MKSFAAVVLLIAGIWANPQKFASRNDPITDGLIDRIEDLSLRIRERGLDPLHINKETREIGLPVPVILSGVGLVEEVDFRGLSNIIINTLSYDTASSVVTFDLEIPYLHLSAELARVEVLFFGNLYTGELAGSLNIGRINVKGNVEISVGVNDIVANSAEIDASIESIQSAIRLETDSYDLTERINNLFNTRIPDALTNFKNELDELIAIYLVRYVNREKDSFF